MELELKTSILTEDLLLKTIQSEVLPIFIINKNPLIDRWSGTAVHWPQLTPDPELYRAFRWLGLEADRFKGHYWKDLSKNDWSKILKTWWLMAEVTSAAGITFFFGLDLDPALDYSWAFAEYLQEVLGLSCQTN